MTTHPVAEICQFEMSLQGLEPRSYLQRHLHTTYNPDIHRRVQTCRQDVCVVCTALTQSIVVDLVFVYCSNCHHFYISRYLDPDALTCGDSSPRIWKRKYLDISSFVLCSTLIAFSRYTNNWLYLQLNGNEEPHNPQPLNQPTNLGKTSTEKKRFLSGIARIT